MKRGKDLCLCSGLPTGSQHIRDPVSVGIRKRGRLIRTTAERIGRIAPGRSWTITAAAPVLSLHCPAERGQRRRQQGLKPLRPSGWTIAPKTRVRMDEPRKMVDEMLATDDRGFTEWELDFLDSMKRRQSHFSEKQALKIESLYQKKM